MMQSEDTQRQRKILEDNGLIPSELTDTHIVKYAGGEFICREDESLDSLLFIFEGTVKVFCDTENGKRLLLCFYRSGGIIGDLELMIGCNTAKTSVQAVSHVKCVSIPVHLNEAVLHSNIRFLNIVGNALANKLNRCSKNSSFIILYPLETRLCSYIEAMCVDGLFQDNLTEIAEMLGTSYRHLLRSLQELCADGVLIKAEKGYKIDDYKALHERARSFYEPAEISSQLRTH